MQKNGKNVEKTIEKNLIIGYNKKRKFANKVCFQHKVEVYYGF